MNNPLISERLAWNNEYRNGLKCRLMEDYRERRLDPSWRLTRIVEQLAEYAFYLETELELAKQKVAIDNV